MHLVGLGQLLEIIEDIMANRNFPQNKLFGFHLLPARIRGSITIGASGAVSSISAPGIASVSKLATGVYQIQLQDNYASFLHMTGNMMSLSMTGSAIDPNAGVVGTLYEITVVGNTDWETAGIPAGITPAVGQVLVLAAAPASGTGRVKALVPSSIASIQVAGNPNNGMMNNQPFQAGSGGFITVMCLDFSGALANPANGDIMLIDILCNSSQVQ